MKTLSLLVPLIAAAGSAGCLTHVDAGHVGVEVNSCSGGGVRTDPVPVGWHTTGPCTSIVEYPTYQQTLLLAKTGEGGDPINVTSSEGLPISADVSLSFTVEGAKVPHIYGKYRKNLEHIQTTFIKQTVREGLQEMFAKYTAQQLYSDKKEIARAEVQGFLTKKLVLDGFNITQFTVNEVRVPEEVLRAIKSKVAMSQSAQEAQQAVARSEAVGRQAVAQATAESEAKKLRADAEAYANRKIADSISPVLVDYIRTQKWDGKLPQVQSGSTPLINLGK